MAAGQSYNGWAANSDPEVINVVPFRPLGIRAFANGGFAGGVKGGPVHAIFTDLVERLNEIEPVMTDPTTGQLGYGCWGYGYRPNVNNPSVLSCHSSGTAIDYNAPKHRNGTSIGAGNSGWSFGNIVRVTALMLRYRGVVRWLSGNDPMHFEISGTEAETALVAASLNRLESDTGTPDTPSTPTQPEAPATPTPAPAEDDDEMYTLIHDDQTDYNYLVAPGQFVTLGPDATTVVLAGDNSGTYTYRTLIEHLRTLGQIRNKQRIELNTTQIVAARRGAVVTPAADQGVAIPGSNPTSYF